MPPPAKKNVSIILLDVNCKPEFQGAAKNCLLNIFASKWFVESKDFAKLILVNTEESNNQLHQKFGQAPHISEVTDVIQYDPKLIHSYLEGAETAKGDWLVALAVAIEEIKDNYINDKGAMTFQILFISDFSSQTGELKQKRVDFIISNLNTLNIFLYVLGPTVKIPQQLSTVDSIRQWAKNVEFLNADPNDPQLTIIKKIVENTKNSVVCSLELGRELFLNYRNYWYTQPWMIPLTAGKGISFPSIANRFLKYVGPPKIKEQGSGKVPYRWHLIDDLNVEVPYDNIIGGIFKHGKFIPLPSDVEKDFKCFGERDFKIVGFTPRSNISEIYLCGSGSFVVQSDARNFNLLLQTLAKKNMCVIARRVSVKNCKPKLVALLPVPEDNAFILVELPYKEEVPHKVTEQDVAEAPNLDIPAIKEVYDFLNTLDITKSENSSRFPLAPTLRLPLRQNAMHKFLLKKYMGDEVNFDDIQMMEAGDDFTPYLHMCPPRTTADSSG